MDACTVYHRGKVLERRTDHTPGVNGLQGSEIALIGGSGFLGRHFLAAARRDGRPVRLLTRRASDTSLPAGAGVTIVPGDLDDAEAVARLVTPGCTVVNFAWSGEAALPDAVRQARQLGRACLAANARMLLHCSTAAVYGGCADLARVVDDTPPRPGDDYGRIKLAVDLALLEELDGRMPLSLLRPTSVFGPHGIALTKLMRDIRRGLSLANYLRSCLSDLRLMHLVPIDTVVDAFRFVEAQAAPGTHCHLIASDDEPLNRFRPLEVFVRQLWQLPDYPAPRLALPPVVLRAALRAMKRMNGLPFTVFDARSLRAAGFVPPVPFSAAVEQFAEWFVRDAEASTSEPAG